MTGQTAAPRAFDVAAALHLSTSSAFPFRWDGLARTWRRLDRDGRSVRFEVVIAETLTTLHEAIRTAAPYVPLAFRCVFADPADVAELEAVADWEADQSARTAAVVSAARAAHEAAEARKRAERVSVEAALAADAGQPLDSFRLASLQPAEFVPPRAPTLVTRKQRERLLSALSRRAVDSALRLASGHDACRYVPRPAPVDVDPRSWLVSLPREPGAVVRRSALYAAYLAALPDGAVPLYDRAFHALAVDVLGPGCRVDRNGRRYYKDLAVPTDAAGADVLPLTRVGSG